MSEQPATFCDVALRYDRAARHADCMIGEDGDLALDFTPATPMTITIGSDRRARDDDPLPQGVDFFSLARGGYGLRRGALADAYDTQGRRCGCRLWLLDRERQDDPDPDLTRRRAIAYLDEAFEWVRDETGEPARVEAQWARPGVLAFTVGIGEARLTIARTVGGA